MGTLTPNLGLFKPAGGDFVSVLTDINNNMDTLDTEIAGLGVQAKIKTSDQLVTTTVAADVTELQFDIEADAYYYVDAVFRFKGYTISVAGATYTTAEIALTGPALDFVDLRDTANVFGNITAYNAYEELFAPASFDATYAERSNNVIGIFRATAAGTLKLQIRQNATNDDPTKPVGLLKGSFMRLTKVNV